MLRTGVFSRFNQVPVKALRDYEQIGLLKPAEIDRSTGCWHCLASPLPRMNRVLALKDLGPRPVPDPWGKGIWMIRTES